MAKLEELLKAQGFTDEEIAANSALLNDPKVRGALETSYQKLEADLGSFKTENENWKNWHEEHGKPTLALYETERNDARAENAGLKERLRLAEEGGFAPTSSHKDPPKDPAKDPVKAFDPKDYKLVTQDDVARFADLEGQAIAMATNLAEEYRILTGGKSIYDYSYATSDGRNLRGMVALRHEAIQAKQPMDKFVESKFDFAGKRQSIADAQKKAAEDAIRAEERAKMAKEYGDPNLRPLVPSREPFIPRNAEGKVTHPWEGDKTTAQRRAERLERAMETQFKGAVQ